MMDDVHLNSIVYTNDKIFVSIFGTKPKEGWHFAKSGKIIEIKENKEILHNLEQPHSLIEIEGCLYFLESKTGRVHRISKENKDEIILALKSYLRGIDHDKKYLYIGGSARRRIPTSPGTPNVPESQDDEYLHSYIFRIDRKSMKWERKDLTIFGTEIYDLLVIPDHYTVNNSEDAVIERIWKYNDEIESLRSKLQNDP